MIANNFNLNVDHLMKFFIRQHFFRFAISYTLGS